MFRNTIKNKLVAISLTIIGTVPVIIDSDATALLVFSFFAIPLFFAKENIIE